MNLWCPDGGWAGVQGWAKQQGMGWLAQELPQSRGVYHRAVVNGQTLHGVIVVVVQYYHVLIEELKEFILKKIDEGEMFLSLDIKPNFDDTPDYWETDLESLFTSPKK